MKKRINEFDSSTLEATVHKIEYLNPIQRERIDKADRLAKRIELERKVQEKEKKDLELKE